MDNITIRKVKETDASEWYNLKNKVWRDAYKNIFPEEVFIRKENNLSERVTNFGHTIKNDDENIAYVAECDGKIIGLMRGSIKSAYGYFKNEYSDLTALYIDPEYQGRKIGTKFKNIFEKWAKENGSTKYVIGVLKDNAKARKVYEAWGGKLSDYAEDFIEFGVNYPEVFYTFTP